ncbi:MAG: putative portal protein [Prokaryotic dsDNA virus sp.]|jgi:HK97 family phage portal protein|nr:MAG: putative portal protein [Prokaryotic dsDNA virus sp.]|tara:strand:- start:3182 stop:4855 length:1674 start_codon:yes stop_codon:yes gene_type:complete
MAERRKFTDIIFNRNNTEEKRLNTFRDEDSLYNNMNFIQGYNNRSGAWDVSTMGNGASNSAVVACLQVLGTSFSEAGLSIKKINDEGFDEDIPNHSLVKLMRRPNPYMSGDIVQQYIINAMHVSGDAYLLKQRNNAGQVIALYPLMPEEVTPQGTKEDLITFYEYDTNNKSYLIKPEDIVHIRLGLDPNNHKKGFAPLRSVLREIFGDESAGQLATALLSNSGVPSVLITPRTEYSPTQDEAEQIARTYQEKTAGKNKGKPLVVTGAMKVEKMAFSPTELDIGTLRRVPEERISAVLGVPAILAGLGSGLAHATYSNAETLREFFTENKLIPLWKQVGEEITQQLLLKDYAEENQELSAYYDFSNVRALQQDMDELYNRLNIGVQGGWITVAEAREQVGLPTNEKQDVYLLDMNKLVTPANLTQEVQDQEKPQEPEEEIELEDDEEKIYDDYQINLKVVKEIDGEFCVIAEESGKNMGCYPTRELAEVRLRQISRFADEPKAMVGKDEFTTIEEARDRAEELGCSGTHTHDENGNTIYMPCSTHEEYESRLADYDRE